MRYLLITASIAILILINGCAEECTPDQFENFKLEANLDPTRNYLTATDQTLGVIKVVVKDMAGNVIDASNNTNDLRLKFTFTGGGEARDFDDRVYEGGIAPIGTRFTEVFWYMGTTPGNNTMRIELVQEIGSGDNITHCGDFPGVEPILYSANASSNIPANGVLPNNARVFVIGDESNPDFKQTWVYGNRLRSTHPTGLANLGVSGKCPENVDANCSNYGALVDWQGAMKLYQPEENHILPSESDMFQLITYLQEIGFENVAEYFYYAPFNLDTKRGGGFFGNEMIPQFNHNLNDFDKINEMTIFWLADDVGEGAAKAFVYSDDGSLQRYTNITAPKDYFFNIRVMQK